MKRRTISEKVFLPMTEDKQKETLKEKFLEKLNKFRQLYAFSPKAAVTVSTTESVAMETKLKEYKTKNKTLVAENEQLSDQIDEQAKAITKLKEQVITDRAARNEAINDEKQMLCEAMLKFTPKSIVRNYGKGYDPGFKHFIKVQLASKCPNFWAWGDENRRSFIELYNFLDQFLGKKFYDEEFKIFLDTMHKEGKQGPAAPKYDFNKLDLVSCNEFWQTIAKVAINSYIDARITKEMGEKQNDNN